jgi:hypothetical protein
MASNDTPTMATFGGQYPVRKCKLPLAITASTSTYAISTSRYRGTIEKVELDPGAQMATSATLKGYQVETSTGTSTLAAGTRDQFLNYTFPASEVELVFYPMVGATANTGGALTTATSTKYVIEGYIRVDLEAGAVGDSVDVYVYVRG